VTKFIISFPEHANGATTFAEAFVRLGRRDILIITRYRNESEDETLCDAYPLESLVDRLVDVIKEDLSSEIPHTLLESLRRAVQSAILRLN
jgi:hypothetical protein